MPRATYLLMMCLMAGCSAVLPAGLMRLTTLSPLEADPEGFAVTLDLPADIEIAPGSATLTLEATQTARDQTASGSFRLAESEAPDGGQTYRIATHDLERFRALQAQINAWESEDADATQGSLSVMVDACRLGDGPAPDSTVSVALQTAMDEEPFPLLRDAPLSRILRPADSAGLRPCD